VVDEQVWVKSGHSWSFALCPLYPQKRTLIERGLERAAVTSEGNRILWSTYPESVRHWIKRHGGLHSQTITLSGPELAAMFPACP
jgi:hypothetical protein